MKLKNKETGEIKDYADVVFMRDANNWHHRYHSLAELCEEWEDYKEPKIYFYLSSNGAVYESDKPYCEEAIDEIRKQLGNYFETKEEAEKAVEKLKAWKRLKDKGFKICGWNMAMRELDVKVPEKFFDKQGPITMGVSDETRKDLDLLFCMEEENE